MALRGSGSFGLEDNALLEEMVFSKKPELLTPAEADALYEAADKLFCFSKSVDVGSALCIHRLLYAYAKLHEDRDMMIRELYHQGMTGFYLNLKIARMDINVHQGGGSSALFHRVPPTLTNGTILPARKRGDISSGAWETEIWCFPGIVTITVWPREDRRKRFTQTTCAIFRKRCELRNHRRIAWSPLEFPGMRLPTPCIMTVSRFYPSCAAGRTVSLHRT